MNRVDHFLDGFFQARSVAVVGATNNPIKINYRLVQNLVHLGFEGRVYPVNPKAQEICGVKGYARLEDVPERIDMVVSAVPASKTFDIVKECAAIGVTRLVTNQVLVSSIDKTAGFDTVRLVFDSEFRLFGATFHTTLVWWIVLTLIATWILMRTKHGNWIFAVGGDANAARNVGVPSNRVKIALFMTTAIAGWLVGMMYIARLRSAVASQGIGQEFVFIISAVIGGCLLTGGYGSAIGAAIGAIIFGMARVGIVFAGWDTDWFYSFLGIMLLVAVLVNQNTRRRAESMSIAAAKVRTEEEGENG